MTGNPIGEMVDRFRIIDQIGSGGMGEVYVGVDEFLNRKVALKSIRREHRLNEEARARFLREARVLSQLKHPNICQIYDYVQGPDADFLVLELIHGRSLSVAMTQGLKFKQKLRIAEQIADVLVAAHERGVIHRDLKPENVMLSEGDVVKVLDFGISSSHAEAATLVLRPPLPMNSEPGMSPVLDSDVTTPLPSPGSPGLDSSADRVTSLGTIMGTLGHMSPEQARGEIATPASDLYSFGLLLQELFTEKPVYAADAVPMALLLKAQAGETLPFSGIDNDLAALIRRLESPTQAARPSATETRDRLRWIALSPQRRRRKLLLTAAIAVLVIFGIAMTFQMLRATRAEKAARAEEERANREAEASKKVSEFLVGIFKISDPGQARGSSVTARELLDHGAATIDKELQDQPQVRARLMDTIGMVYLRLGLYEQADPLLRAALEIRRKSLGAVHPDVAQSLHDLGILSWSRGKYLEAEPLFRSAIAIRETALGPDNPDLAKSLNSLAVVYKTQGKYAQAEPLYLRSFRISEKALGPDHPDLATNLNNLASFYYSEKKYAAAEPLLLRGLAIKEKSLGPDHPDVASTLNNIGQLMATEEKYAEAEPFLRRSLAIREKVLGAEHPDVAESLTNLGSLYVSQGKFDQAEPMMIRALTIRQHALGADHADVGETLGELATLRRKQHRFDEAEKLYDQAASVLEKAGDPTAASVLEEHAEMSLERGKLKEASALKVRAEALRKKLDEN